MEHYQHEIRPIDSLVEYANNARTHSAEQVEQVAASMREFKFTNPILIDEAGGIIAGHGRVLAAKSLDYDEVPCIILSGLSDEQKKAYVIADNQLALNASWDLDLLKLEIEDLQAADFDIDLLGFENLDFLFPDENNSEIEEVDYSEVFNVIVECSDEHQQEVVYKKLQAEGYSCQVQSL